MNQAIVKELETKRNTGKKIPPMGIKASDFWRLRPSHEHVPKKRKAHFRVTCVNKHEYKTDVKPPQHCPVCHVVVDRRGYV